MREDLVQFGQQESNKSPLMTDRIHSFSSIRNPNIFHWPRPPPHVFPLRHPLPILQDFSPLLSHKKTERKRISICDNVTTLCFSFREGGWNQSVCHCGVSTVLKETIFTAAFGPVGCFSVFFFFFLIKICRGVGCAGLGEGVIAT